MRDRRWPLVLAGLVLLLGLALAPRVFHHYDVVECFLPWSRASEGVRPWDVYTPGVGADDCDYPPLVPYLLTAAEAGRRAAGAAVIALLALPPLPHVLGGRGPAVLKAYTGAVSYYPYRSIEAYNGWYGQGGAGIPVTV